METKSYKLLITWRDEAYTFTTDGPSVHLVIDCEDVETTLKLIDLRNVSYLKIVECNS